MKKLTLERLNETKAYLLRNCVTLPKMVIVLGSGLGKIVENLSIECELEFGRIPNFKRATVEGHAGKLVIGALNGVRVACLVGRLHFYEGHSMQDVVFPMRALAWAGSEIFILTNASGGLDSRSRPPFLLLIQDHLNWMGTNPLIGENEEALGPRFPDLTCLYDPELRKLFLSAANKVGILLREGVYAAIHGPSFETPAEVRMYKALGADVVGMSTVPEAIALRHMGKRVIGISCVTNTAAGESHTPLNHEEVLRNASQISSSFLLLLQEALPKI